MGREAYGGAAQGTWKLAEWRKGWGREEGSVPACARPQRGKEPRTFSLVGGWGGKESPQEPQSNQRPSETFKVREAVTRYPLPQDRSGCSGDKRETGRQIASVPVKAKQSSSGREGALSLSLFRRLMGVCGGRGNGSSSIPARSLV